MSLDRFFSLRDHIIRRVPAFPEKRKNLLLTDPCLYLFFSKPCCDIFERKRFSSVCRRIKARCRMHFILKHKQLHCFIQLADTARLSYPDLPFLLGLFCCFFDLF